MRLFLTIMVPYGVGQCCPKVGNTTPWAVAGMIQGGRSGLGYNVCVNASVCERDRQIPVQYVCVCVCKRFQVDVQYVCLCVCV